MRYTITIHKKVKKKLLSLDKSTQLRIIDKLDILACNPDDPSLDIKKLQCEPHFRLRVGDWRVLFLCERVLKIIAVEKLKSRGEVYK